MDELSMDSSCRDKAEKLQDASEKSEKELSTLGSIESSDRARSHFRIDWRQLTYYQKPKSFIEKCLSGRLSPKEVNNLSYEQRKAQENQPKKILNSLDGCFRSGELSAILGPSGAGKTTFLSTLFGSKQDDGFGQTKVTWLNEELSDQKGAGRPSKRRPLRIAFLPQHDHLLHHLTVYETLMFASKIKNATRKGRSKNFHRSNVKRVAKMLKLSECLDTRCNKLSGGQYKRVSIGQELLSNPDVIILDEPTSGLDAMTCLTTIQTLKSIVTQQPMSIILTIHQPDMDVFRLFDQVYVIAQGGLAIYEGPPSGILSTLAEVNLHPPMVGYNPARFIVENSFVADANCDFNRKATFDGCNESGTEVSASDSESETDECKDGKSYIKRSMLSLSDALTGREMASDKHRRDKRPLLNIGVQTIDGQLITSNQLNKVNPADCSKYEAAQVERMSLLKRLNAMQKAKYYPYGQANMDHLSDISQNRLSSGSDQTSSGRSSASNQHPREVNNCETNIDKTSTSGKSDYSSAGWSDNHKASQGSVKGVEKANSLAELVSESPTCDDLGKLREEPAGSMQMIDSSLAGRDSILSSPELVVLSFSATDESRSSSPRSASTWKAVHAADLEPLKGKRRQFDKRLSAKHNCSRQNDNPIWYHTFLLTHRTWLSIIRDPIFFGIQAAMHTIIPLLLALIFGSVQDEGCPRLGNFDLVQFAYSDNDDFIQQTIGSIRSSMGNIGIVFFEMFVLSFSINCITALVFPLDMYVLLKEYRNGWYSMRSYFFGRTLADLPIPVVLHSMGMSILYFMTSQPHSLWRFLMIILMVILASFVAQSVGLTIGAILMKSSQSAVLTAAGIVAPFFALSGFIVRIHTLPFFARMAAKASYLYHLLNGFIILRYGYGRCPCEEQDLYKNEAHQVPSNIRTLASMWIGTYSDEFANSTAVLSHLGQSNRTNIDPNIDLVEKMMSSLKMANSYGHQINDCKDVIPYAMLDFNLKDDDLYECLFALVIMLIISRIITFSAIYYKIRSFT